MTLNNLRASQIALAFTLLAGLVPMTSSASIARAVSFEDKVSEADSIVMGRCVKTRSTYDPSGKWIVTYSTFQVAKAIKGQQSSEVTVVTPGGSVGSMHQETVGVPHFREGEDNLLFVKQEKLGPSVLYFDQGAYSVEKDSRGEAIIQPVASELVLIDTQAGKAVAGEQSRRTLSQFENDVQIALKGHHNLVATESMLGGRRQAGQKIAIASSLRQFLSNNSTILLLVSLGLALSTVALIRRR